MALTPTFSKGGDYEIAEDGKYVCRISAVTLEDRPSYDNPEVLEPNFVFEFETGTEHDSKDRPYKFFAYTKIAYGNEKAKLTLIVNGIFGRAFLKEQVAQMDFEKLVGKQVGVLVGITDSGKNKVLSVKALAKSPIAYEDVLIDTADSRVAPPPQAAPRPAPRGQAPASVARPAVNADDEGYDPFAED